MIETAYLWLFFAMVPLLWLDMAYAKAGSLVGGQRPELLKQPGLSQ